MSVPGVLLYTPPQRCSSGCEDGTHNFKIGIFGDARWPSVYDLGCYNCRNVAGTNFVSAHGEGWAQDFGFPLKGGIPNAEGFVLANWLVANAVKLGVQAVVWNRRCWGFGRWYWRDYGGESPHTDHVHAELNSFSARNLTLVEVEKALKDAPSSNNPTPPKPKEQNEMFIYSLKEKSSSRLLGDGLHVRLIRAVEGDRIDFLYASNTLDTPIKVTKEELRCMKAVDKETADLLAA